MAFKLMTFATLVAVASAGVLPGAPLAYQTANIAPLTYSHQAPVAYAAPVTKAVYAETHDNEYDSHPQYSYSYDVHDSLTGDAKSQQETRNGDAVEGSYSFVEADGTRRVVHYTADDQNGFNAVVEKQPAQVAVKTVSPVVYQSASPVVKTVSPVYQSASPVVKTVSPVVYQSASPVVKTVSPVVYQSASPFVKTYSPLAYQAATPVVKTVTPVAHATYAAPAYYQHSSPLYNVAAPLTHATYAAPLYHH